MRLTTIFMSLPLAFTGTMLVATACAPGKNSATVKLAPGVPTKKMLENCAKEASSTKTIRVPKAGGTKTIRVCQAVAANEGWTYQPIDRPIHYLVSNANKQITISIGLRVALPEGTTKDDRVSVFNALTQQCEARIKPVWERSGITLDLRFTDLHQSGPMDDTPILGLMDVSEDAKFKGYVLAEYPDRTPLLPNGTPQEDSICAKKAKWDQHKCRWQMRAAANSEFCLNLASLIGNLVGLDEGDPSGRDCRAGVQVTSTSTPAPGAKGKPELPFTGYQKSLIDPAARKEFWEKGRLSSQDLKKILGPTCLSLGRSEGSGNNRGR